jgi:hypothetical protein
VLSSITKKFTNLPKTTMRKQHFCGDTLNLFAREDQNYHWSRSYWYYSNLLDKENNKVWTSGIALVGYVPEVFECKDIITWCIDKLVQNRRTIPLQSESLVSLAPSVFKKMLRLSEPNLVYKGEEAKNFLKRKNNGIELLQEYLQDPASMSEDLSRIQVSSLKDPYK